MINENMNADTKNERRTCLARGLLASPSKQERPCPRRETHPSGKAPLQNTPVVEWQWAGQKLTSQLD